MNGALGWLEKEIENLSHFSKDKDYALMETINLISELKL